MFIKGKELNSAPGFRSILLIQFGDIGDVVYTLPCARALKETFPEARVVIAVYSKAKDLVAGSPWIDGVIAVDKGKRPLLSALGYQLAFWRQVRGFGFDLAIDLRTGSRGAILAFCSGARQRLGRYNSYGHWWRGRLFTHLVLPEGRMNQAISEYYHDTLSYYGIRTAELNPVIIPTPEQEAEAESLLRREGVPGDRPLLVIQPFSLWAYKEWGLEKLVALIRALQADLPLSVALTGSSAEEARALALAKKAGGAVCNLAGQTPLNLLPAVLKQADLFLGVDSAGLHIAAAVGTSTVGIYGPSAADTWAPKGERHQVITKPLPCVPCKETGCQGSMRSRCLDELTVAEVLPIVREALQRACR